MPSFHPAACLEFFFIKTGKLFQRVDFVEIYYIQAERNYCKIVTNTTSYLINFRFHDLEKFLPSERFCRIHRSFIVALDKVKSFNREQVHIKELVLPVGKEQGKTLFEHCSVLSHQTAPYIAEIGK